MGFLVSPGVDVNEIDLTNVIPAVSTSIGGTVGAFNWGPIDEIVQVGSEKDLVTRFGKPDDDTYAYFYNAALFLKYGNALKIVRYSGGSGESALKNASGGTADLIKNRDDYDDRTITDAIHGSFIARCAGSAGNDLSVVVITATSFGSANSGAGSTYANKFDAAPGEGEIHIVVLDEGGSFAEGATSSSPVILETYANLSISSTAKAETGGSNYYIDVLNNQSAFVFGGYPLTTTEIGTSNTEDIETDLDNGADYSSITNSDVVADYAEFFGDAESVDVNFFIGGALSSTDADTVIATAEDRKDVIAFVSPPVDDVSYRSDVATAVGAARDWANGINSSSYGVLDSASVMIYDKYNDKNRFTGAAGLVAG